MESDHEIDLQKTSGITRRRYNLYLPMMIWQAIDEYAKANSVTFAEAIRTIIAKGIEAIRKERENAKQ